MRALACVFAASLLVAGYDATSEHSIIFLMCCNLLLFANLYLNTDNIKNIH